MLKRTLTALLLIPPVVYLIGWSPEWLFVLAVATAVVLALREYFALCRATGFKPLAWAGYVGAVGLCSGQTLPRSMGYIHVVNYSLLSSYYIFALLAFAFILLLIPTLALERIIDLKDYLAGTSVTVFGILYMGFSLSCLVWIRFGLNSSGAYLGWGLSFGSAFLLLLFLVIWAGDIFAYLVGRSIGCTPFFARISPHKTWEGALAGLTGSVLAGWGFAHWVWKAADVRIMLLAAWIAVAGQTGDLVESAIKRGANQKDSGTLLPGHGGFLDRIDSLLFAAPALWLAMKVFGSSS